MGQGMTRPAPPSQPRRSAIIPPSPPTRRIAEVPGKYARPLPPSPPPPRKTDAPASSMRRRALLAQAPPIPLSLQGERTPNAAGEGTGVGRPHRTMRASASSPHPPRALVIPAKAGTYWRPPPHPRPPYRHSREGGNPAPIGRCAQAHRLPIPTRPRHSRESGNLLAPSPSSPPTLPSFPRRRESRPIGRCAQAHRLPHPPRALVIPAKAGTYWPSPRPAHGGGTRGAPAPPSPSPYKGRGRRARGEERVLESGGATRPLPACGTCCARA